MGPYLVRAGLVQFLPHRHLGSSPVAQQIRISAAVLSAIVPTSTKASVMTEDPLHSTNQSAGIELIIAYTRTISQPCQVAGTQPQPYVFALNQRFSPLITPPAFVSTPTTAPLAKTSLRGNRRRRKDSNPRGPCDPNGFQDRRIRPLCHSSDYVQNFI